MPLTEPNLDDRNFEQILADLRFRIPRYTKEWTNYNDSDPGMTLLQLFAWLTDQIFFRMNQVPRKNYVKFLKLLGEELKPPQPATAHLTFVTKGDAKAEPIPKRTQVAASLGDGGDDLIFETERDLDLITPKLDVVGLFDGAGFLNATSANDAPGTKFKPFGVSPDAGNALYLGFVPPEVAVPFPQTMTFRIFLPSEATAGKPRACEGTTTPPIAPVTLVWEYRPKDGEPWLRLNVREDETAAFTREGYIRVAGPRDIEPSSEPRLEEEPRYWIRVGLDSGKNYPAGHAPEIDFLRPNTVEAVNLSTVRGEVLGVSKGHPREQFETQHKPISELTLQLIFPTGEVETWTRVDDLLASTQTSNHYRLIADSGIVQFGDGDRGRIPEAGTEVLALEYRHGGGTRGNNAGPGTISGAQSELVGVDTVTNERSATGGSDEQTLEDILLTGPTLLRQRGRAVTPEDFQHLVEKIGGVAHAVAIPLMHPDHPQVKVPGAVTVVVVPDHDDKPPKPSSDLLRAICSTLDGVRLLTTEVFVKGPEYQEIRVEGRVTANPYASFDTVSTNVLKAIDALIDPRRGDFGRELFPTQLYGAILAADVNVVNVRNLNIYVDGRLHDGRSPIRSPRDGLLYGGDHFITVEQDTDL